MGSAESKMQKQLIDLRITAKQLNRESGKLKKASDASKKKLANCIREGNMEGARIHANNAIRNKQQSLNMLQLSSRIEAVAQRVQQAISANRLNKNMAQVVKGMDAVLKSMDTDKIGRLMDKFEENFDDLDVRTGYMNAAIDGTTAGIVDGDNVDELIAQVADEAGLELAGELDGAGNVSTKAPPQKEADANDLQARFEALNSGN